MPVHPYLLDSSHLRSFPQLRSIKRLYSIQPSDLPAIATSRNVRGCQHPSSCVVPLMILYQVLRRVTFNSLPIELQNEIFFFCMSPFPRLSIIDAPIVLARVCSAWRSIVLSTPRLWSSFEVEIQGSGPSGLLHDTRLMHRMKIWLERSCCSPLSIRLVYNSVGRLSDDRSTQLLTALVSQARRWRNAHFTLPAASIAKLQFPPNSLPTLRSLAFKVTGVPSDSPLNILAMNIPWQQLTGLDLRLEPSNLPTFDVALDILSQTVNLKYGTLRLECTWDRRDTHRDKSTLPTLDTLQLILQDANSATDRIEACLMQFLNLLCLPKLRVLRLGWLANGNLRSWSLAHTDFFAFLGASAKTLRELKMTYFPISENELLKCLAQVPQLTHLDLRFAMHKGVNDPITNRLLAACTIPSSSTVSGGIACTSTSAHAEIPLLPRLEHVNLQCHGSLYTNATLLDFIRSMWKSGKGSEGQDAPRALRYFRLLSMKPVPSEVEKQVRAWNEEGLEIDIQCLVVR
jgi:hypothetical protein